MHPHGFFIYIRVYLLCYQLTNTTYMRTIVFSVHVPKNMTKGYVRKALDTIFKAPLNATKQKLRDITDKMYVTRSMVESIDEEVIRLSEEHEKVNQGKQIFREIEHAKDLEFA